MPVYRQAATPPVFTTSLQFIGYLRRLLRNHEKLAGFTPNPSTWSRGPSPLSDTQGRWNGAQCHVKGVQSRSRDAQSRWRGAQSRWRGAQSRWRGAQSRLFSENYSRFLVSMGVAVIYLFFQGHGAWLLAKGCVTESVQTSGRRRPCVRRFSATRNLARRLGSVLRHAGSEGGTCNHLVG